ncbi:MAG: hypothetical protein WBD79_05990, partial [Anaerolineae bacterium]
MGDRGIVFLLFFLLLIEPAPAPDMLLDQHRLILVGQLVGDVSAIVLDGVRAYVGLGTALLVLDVSQPAVPLLVGRSAALPAPITALALAQSAAPATHQDAPSAPYLYLLASCRIHVMDVRDPSQPVSIGSYRLPDHAEDLTVTITGTGAAQRVYAYVAAGEHGLSIVDMTDPTHLVEVGGYDTPGYAWRVAIDTETNSEHPLAYIADQMNFLYILDVSNPTHPAQIGVYSGYAGSLAAGGVAAVPGYVFLGDSSGFKVLDTRDPTQPQLRFSVVLEGGFVTKIRIRSDYLLAFSQSGSLSLHSTADPRFSRYAHFDTYGEPLDVAAAPPLPGQEIPLAYVASGSRGLQVVSWADPTHPVRHAEYDLPGNAYGVAVAMTPDGAVAYVTDRDRSLHIIDVTTANQPLARAVYEGGDVTWNVALAGHYAYVAAGVSGMHIIDVVEPDHPIAVGLYNPTLFNPEAFIRDVVVSGHYAYVTDRAYGALRIVDIADPRHPLGVGLFDSPGGAYAVAAAPDSPLVYLADGAAGLRIVDVSKPDSPFEVGSWQTPVVAVEVAISGTLAFVAGREEGLHIVDVSNPAQPQLVTTYDTPGLVWGVAVEGAWVYLADGPAGVRLLDVSDPARPRETAAYVTPGYAWNVVVAG